MAFVVSELEAAAGHYDKAIQELEQIAKAMAVRSIRSLPECCKRTCR